MDKIKRIRHLAEGSSAFCVLLLAFGLLYLNGAEYAFYISAAAGLASAVVFAFMRRAGIAVGCIFGIIYLLIFINLYLQPSLEQAGMTGEFVLRAEGREQLYPSYGSVDCTLLSLDGKPLKSTKVRLILTDASPEAIFPGDRITVQGELSETQSANRFTQGSFLTLTQTGEPETVYQGEATVLTELTGFSQRLSNKIQSLMPNDEGALLAALLCGDRSGFSTEYSSSLRASGLSHIAAVSGMHLSILLGILCFILPKKAAMLLAFPLMLAFAAMTGFSPSILRALVMSSLLCTAFLIKREYDAITALAFAGGVIGFLNPFALCSVSFLLSFFSTLGIVLFMPRILGFFSLKMPKRSILLKPCYFVISAISVTLSATVFTLPLQMLFFPSVSLISVLSNLLAAWAVAPAMFAGILLLPVAIFVPALQDLALFIIGLPLKYINGVIYLTGDTLRLTAASENIWLILTAAILLIGALSVYFRKLSISFFASAAATAIILSSVAGIFTPARISVWGESGNVCISVAKGGDVLNIGAPSNYNGAYFAQNMLETGRNRTVLLTSSSYSSAGGLEASLCDKIYAPAPLNDVEAEVYSESGSLDFNGFTAEVLYLGDEVSAVRIVTSKLSLLDLSAAGPYTPLPEIPKTDALIISASYTNAPRMLTALCARLSPSLVLISGEPSLSRGEISRLCGCEIIYLDSAGSVKIK